MERTELIMGMPIKITTAGKVSTKTLDDIFDYFRSVDDRFSTYKPTSEIMSVVNAGLPTAQWSPEMREVIRRSEIAKRRTHGYFDIRRADGTLDPSGLVKGWAIKKAAEELRRRGVADFSIDAGGDIIVSGDSPSGRTWRIGIRNPFDRSQVVKIVSLRDEAIATSGTAIRGQHIYDPVEHKKLDDIVSLTAIGPTIYDADIFATAGFAMGRKGISFIENMEGFEGYMIDKDGIATMTSGFSEYVR